MRVKPCLWRGCPELVPPGQSYCPRHNHRKAELGLTGGRSLGRDWRRLRATVIRRQHGLCACGRPVVEVHHINGPGDDTQLLALCAGCHAAMHGKTRHG